MIPFLPGRAALRRLSLGLPTILGLKPRGFFIPYRYAGDLPRLPASGAYPEIEPVLEQRRDTFLSVLDEIERHAAALTAFAGEPAGTPRWTQDWFPRLDGAAAYAIVRSRQPRRIVEIGSGHSTRFLARAARDGQFECEITAIDPAPRATLAALANVHHVPATLQSVLDSSSGGASGETAGVLEGLRAGDILFIDSSHILMPGSDVDLFVNRLLPRLPAGVLVHIHDVFLPDDYPPEWAWRAYNEQLAVAPLLVSDAFDVLFASRYVMTRLPESLPRTLVSLPIPAGAFETSLWLVKRQHPPLTRK